MVLAVLPSSGLVPAYSLCVTYSSPSGPTSSAFCSVSCLEESWQRKKKRNENDFLLKLPLYLSVVKIYCLDAPAFYFYMLCCWICFLQVSCLIFKSISSCFLIFLCDLVHCYVCVTFTAEGACSGHVWGESCSGHIWINQGYIKAKVVKDILHHQIMRRPWQRKEWKIEK